MLGVLTFALQLCLVLFFMLRCWRFDNRIREDLKHPDTVNKLTGEHLACWQSFFFLFQVGIWNFMNWHSWNVDNLFKKKLLCHSPCRVEVCQRAYSSRSLQDRKSILLYIFVFSGVIFCSFSFLSCSSAPPSFHLDIYKQASYQRSDKDATSSSAMSAAGEQYAITSSLFAPSIPWDLVQRWQTPDPPHVYQR